MRLPISAAIFFAHESASESEGKNEKCSFDPIFFAATVPARKATGKDLKDVSEHENDPIEPKSHDTMDGAVEDL